MTMWDLARRVLHRARDPLFLPPLDGLWAARFRGKIICLLYHRVAERGREPFLDIFGTPPISPHELDCELALLARWGGRFISIDDIEHGWRPGAQETGIVITFDDGFYDTYENGLPVVEAHGTRATVFQVAGMTAEAPALIWEHELYRLASFDSAQSALAAALAELGAPRVYAGQSVRELVSTVRDTLASHLVPELLEVMRKKLQDDGNSRTLAKRLYPSPEMIRNALTKGHEVGSHGYNHIRRDRMQLSAFEHELETSRAALTRLCGQPPRSFSYPFDSRHDEDDVVVRRHYQRVFTVARQPLEPKAISGNIPRYTWPGPHPNAMRLRRWLRTGGT